MLKISILKWWLNCHLFIYLFTVQTLELIRDILLCTDITISSHLLSSYHNKKHKSSPLCHSRMSLIITSNTSNCFCCSSFVYHVTVIMSVQNMHYVSWYNVHFMVYNCHDICHVSLIMSLSCHHCHQKNHICVMVSSICMSYYINL